MSRILLFIFISVFLFSCNPREVSEKKLHYNLDSLLNEQIAQLVKANLALEKSVAIGDKESKVTTSPDSTSWSNELVVFRQLEVFNRPTYLNTYHKEDGIKDTKSNLTVLSFTATQPAPVSRLSIYYLGHPGKIKKLEAVYSETNALYSSARNLALEFDEVRNRPLLSRYRIEGEQKMVLSDSVSFKIEGRVIF